MCFVCVYSIPMVNIKEILKDAKKAPSKFELDTHLDAIKALRNKGYSWREIASFLNEHGVKTDHTKIFRFMNKKRNKKMNDYKDYFVPTSDEYVKTLKSLENDISENQMLMLKHHYQAHNRMVTYTELAKVANYPDFKSANLQYGKLGRLIGEKLNMVFAPLEENRDDSLPFYSSAIGSGNIYKSDDNEFQLIMHHEVAKALQNLGWVN